MVKTDRPHAPLGLALFFLSLAVVPATLRVAGYDVSVSPSLSAALDAWRNIAGVLGTSSQSSSETELSLAKKYSFAPETTATEEPAATEACAQKFEADFEPNLEAWIENKPATLPAAAPVVQTRARDTRPLVASRRVVLDRSQRTVASVLPLLLRTSARAEATNAKCLEREAALLRVRELVQRSRALSELLTIDQLHEDIAVFVEIKPIALFAGTIMPPCEGEQAPLGEPATEMFRNAGPRFGVGASEEPESFDFWFEF